MENNKTPSIRFKGFTDPWEQRKLGDTNTFFTDGNYGEAYPKASDMTDSSTGIPFLTGGNLKNGRLDLSGANYITYEKHMKLTSGHLAEDDIVIAVRGSLGALGYVNKENSGWNINSQLAILRTDKTVLIGKYLIQFLLSTTGQKELLSKQTGSALKQLPISSLKDIAIPITSIEEQERIGMYLQNLDNLITLHQRKYNKLLNVKKSMLEKMFPKNGSNIPEIRFKGFTDPWEQRKAKNLFVSTADKGHPELPVLSATQERGMIRRDENSINIYHDKKNEEGYKRVLPGQFVIHLRSFQGGFAHSAIEGITSPAYTVFGFSEPEKHNPNYWKYVFTSKEFIRRLETVTYGIRDGRSISYDEFLTMDFVYPTQDEQTEIANYLDTLDRLITLHQRELEKLQYIKKSMLEKMFV